MPKVTEQVLVILVRKAQQQKYQRDTKSENKTLRQTHVKKLAWNFSPITNKIEKADISTTKLG